MLHWFVSTVVSQFAVRKIIGLNTDGYNIWRIVRDLLSVDGSDVMGEDDERQVVVGTVVAVSILIISGVLLFLFGGPFK